MFNSGVDCLILSAWQKNALTKHAALNNLKEKYFARKILAADNVRIILVDYLMLKQYDMQLCDFSRVL